VDVAQVSLQRRQNAAQASSLEDDEAVLLVFIRKGIQRQNTRLLEAHVPVIIIVSF
jgi:hypothetical protein